MSAAELLPPAVTTKGLAMGYFDGNTVTAMWNYAQHYAMSDNSYSSQFGPSSPGAINLIAGQANGFAHTTNVQDGSGNLLHPTHEAFGSSGSNCRSNTFSATGIEWLESVVCLNLPRVFAAIPAARMSLATKFTQHACPRPTNSAWIRGLP